MEEIKNISVYAIPGVVIRELNFYSIVNLVCKYYDLPVEKVKGKLRKREFVLARHICAYFLRLHTNATLENIGDFFGGRDHTTVIHSVATIKDFIHIKDDIITRDIKAINKIFINQ